MTTMQRQRRARWGACPCCERELDLSFHHLIPRKVHRRAYFSRRYSREQLSAGVYLCRDCHDAVHCHYGEMELAKNLNSLERLIGDGKLARHFSWLARQRRQHARSVAEH